MEQEPNLHLGLDSSHVAFLVLKLISTLLPQDLCVCRSSVSGYLPHCVAWSKHHHLGDTFLDPVPAWEFPSLPHVAAQLTSV